MSPGLTFAFGLLLLALFGWYFATERFGRKRWLGVVLTVLLVAFCAEELFPVKKNIRLGLDLQGGTSFLIRLVREPGAEPITKDLLDRAVEVIRKRVDAFGVSEPDISPQGDDRILVQIPGLDNEEMQQTKEQLQKVAKLEFSIVDPRGQSLLSQVEAGTAIMPPGLVVKQYSPDEGEVDADEEKVTIPMVINRKADFSGEYVTKAYPTYSNEGWGISVEMNSEGGKLFDNVARVNKGNQMAILLDGEILSAPVLQTDRFGGRMQISGNFKEQEARDLASSLENPLRVPVEIEETRSVSPTLGEDSIRAGFYAGLLGLGFVVVFVLIYYRFAGVIALVGLAVNILLLFGMMAMFNFVLTLPGIAGIILTIGMAVDANVLIYERLREELAAGKTISAAVNGAYEKAFSAIFDANLTTLITAVILFLQATGSVKGFAVTLTLGIIASMFSALLVTRTAYRWLIEKGHLKKLTMMNIIPKNRFDFLGKRKFAVMLSLGLILGSIAIFAIRGANNFGIDFRGGDLLVVDSEQPISVKEAREAVPADLRESVVIQMESEGTTEMLTFRSPEDTGREIVDAVAAAYPDRGVKVEGEDTVGARIGMEFATRALWALGLGMVGILIYVTLRFEFSFALGAVVAVLHDVIITLGMFSLIGGELSLVMVGAILTIAGYSINDTIVVFDRIRESLKSGRAGSVQDLMNEAINDTLGRTILTGGTTALSVGALYVFGGAVLEDFAFAILMGIIVGTFSSIFVAAPIVLWWTKIRGHNIRREVLESEAMRRTASGSKGTADA
ncbi:MAG: protein translocase subunit SecD [Chthoniobacterales bacterium]